MANYLYEIGSVAMASSRRLLLGQKLLIKLALGACLAWTSYGAAFQNGSFELGINPNSDLPGGSTAITGWVVTGGLIAWVNGDGAGGGPSDGTYFVDLNGCAPPESLSCIVQGGIQQTFDTTIGSTYTVKFDLHTNNDPFFGPPVSNTVHVSAAGATQNFSTPIGGWQTFTFTFTATATQTTLAFASLSPGTAGPELDNVQVIRGCQVDLSGDIPLFLQGGGSSWAGLTYDNSNSTIAAQGCALTSLSMALNFAGITMIGSVQNNPGTLNTFMESNSLFTGRLGHTVDWDSTVALLDPSFRFDAFNGYISSISDPQGAFDTLDHFLCSDTPLPVIVGVRSTIHDLTFPFPGHFVLVTGSRINPDQTITYLIADPAGTATTLDDFVYTNAMGQPEFETRGAVHDPGGDVSRLNVSTGGTADVLVIDPNGRRTGFDPVSKQRLQEIPQSADFMDALNDDVADQPATETDHLVQIYEPLQGAYNVQVTGLTLGPYVLSINAFSQAGTPQPMSVQGIAAPGSSTEFQIQFASAPGLVSHIARTATFQSTLADIANCLQAGLISTKSIAGLLSQSIEAAQKATGPLQVLALKAFGVLIDALAAGNQITGAAPQILLQDAAFLLGVDAPLPRSGKLTENFNSIPVPSGDFVWFNSAINVVGVVPGIPTNISVTGAAVSYVANGTTYSLSVPKGTIAFSPSATSATTTFDTANNQWETTIPFSGVTAGGFLAGVALPAPSGLPGGINQVTWAGTFSSDTPGVVVNWQWGAAVYSQFSTAYGVLGIQPTSQGHETAGSPVNFQAFLLPGGTGKGGSNYTGSYLGVGLLVF